ncbi:MAG: alpha,alpha-trehalase, partial [Clostridia bacterium]|nr:alpha,alpha-trehalase [Clostridia bacterium]
MRELLEFIGSNWDGTLRHNVKDEDTLIGLPKPYTVPSINDRFNELYYWDTYFTNLGLILSDKLDYAINNTENIAYLIDKYGFMPNGNRKEYLNRSQPPFFTLMVRDIYNLTGDKKWLAKMYKTAEKEYNFWQTKRTTPTGLNRYYHNLSRDDEAAVRESAECLCRRYGLEMPEDYSDVYSYAENIRIVCESGWDCNSRFGMHNRDFNWIDLNSLLYCMEENMAFFATELKNSRGILWEARASRRLALLNKYCWNEEAGMFSDYDFVNGVQSNFLSLASFYPLFAGIANDEQAAKTVANLYRLEQEFGVACCEYREDLMGLQWDYPHGWAPLHYMLIDGLLRYGYVTEAERIARKYCAVVENNFDKTGNIWEHYDTVTGEVSVTQEKNSQSTMMAWSAGVYLCCRE